MIGKIYYLLDCCVGPLHYLAQRGIYTWVKVAENLARWSLGVFIYNVYAELFHHPSILIVESLIPFWAAVVAAPILTLCPE